MTFDQFTAALPGGVSLSHLRVYSTGGPTAYVEEVRTCILLVVKRIS
jgi:hypothetical protein